jgi:hypothetical protein
VPEVTYAGGCCGADVDVLAVDVEERMLGGRVEGSVL